MDAIHEDDYSHAIVSERMTVILGSQISSLLQQARAELRSFSGVHVTALGYLLTLLLAELSINNVENQRIVMILFAVVLFLLLIHAAINLEDEDRPFLLALSVLPLSRLLGFSVHRADLDAPLTAAGLTAMIALSLALVLRQMRMPLRELGFRLPLQFKTLIWLGIAAAGGAALAGLLFLFAPVPIFNIADDLPVSLPVLLALGIAVAVVEELVFRGALLHAGRVMGGVVAVVYAVLAYAVMQVGYYEVPVIALSAAGGLLFGIATLKSRSLLPAVVGHTLANALIVLFGYPLLTP